MPFADAKAIGCLSRMPKPLDAFRGLKSHRMPFAECFQQITYQLSTPHQGIRRSTLLYY